MVFGLGTRVELTTFKAQVMSWSLVAVTLTPNGSTAAIDQNMGLEPRLPRLVGFGPLNSPPDGAGTILLSMHSQRH